MFKLKRRLSNWLRWVSEQPESLRRSMGPRRKSSGLLAFKGRRFFTKGKTMNFYNIQCSLQDPYSGVISTFIKKSFPNFLKAKDKSTLDLLTEAIVGSGQVRFGPKPSPESLVSIREVISFWMQRNQPIPFLSAWGSEKPDGSGIDVAELFALKTLSCLNSRVKQFYSPGIQMTIRVEDASAPHLFFEDMDAARKNAAVYTQGFINLVRALGIANTSGTDNSFLNILPETKMTSEAAFNARADEILPVMEAHLSNLSDEVVRGKIREFGWREPVNQETVDFYFDRYSRLYPSKSEAEHRYILARYLSGALARHSLKIMGVDASWERMYLELSFAPPAPGLDAGRAKRRLYYRTLPSSITNNHCAAWRSKGYLKISSNSPDEVNVQLTSFNKVQELDLNDNVIYFSNGEVSQEVKADYVVD